jgi:hypothetical protein
MKENSLIHDGNENENFDDQLWSGLVEDIDH